MNKIILECLSIVGLLALSAFFSASEIAFASVNPVRMKARSAASKNPAVDLAYHITKHYDTALSAILIGNTLVNIAASSIATVIVIRLLRAQFAWVATVGMTLLVLTFGEILPKVLAKQFAERYAVAVSVPVFALTWVLWPVTTVVMLFVKAVSKIWEKSVTDPDAVTEADLGNILEVAGDEGVLDEDRCDLLQNALEFNEVLAYEIITPRVDLEALDIRDHYEINIRKIVQSTYSRLPVFEDTPDHIIGILHTNHALKELTEKKQISLRELMLPVTFVHKTMPLPDVLEKMKQTKTHMVVVLDEYGGTMGILTMEDVLEQLVGEIWDETDEIEREFVCVDDTHFEAVGEMRLDDFFEEFDLEPDEDTEADNTTVGGWVTSMLEGEIGKGDSFVFDRLTVTVSETDEHRVERVSVTLNEPEEPEPDEE